MKKFPKALIKEIELGRGTLDGQGGMEQIFVLASHIKNLERAVNWLLVESQKHDEP
jgi:hypothetical protein